MTASQHTIESEDAAITQAVGPPWSANPKIYSWGAQPTPFTTVRFQFREFGAVMEVDGECVCWKDARTPKAAAPVGLQDGLDVASYQPKDLSQLIQSLGARHVIVRLYNTWESPSQDHSTAQIESAWANGCTVAGYIWLYQDINGADSVDDALKLADRAGLVLPILWLDCETYTDGSFPDEANIGRAVARCQERGIKVGLYTGEWFWRDYLGNTPAFGDLPLWHAAYGTKPAALTPVDYGGWAGKSPHVWQWTSDPVDQNVVDSSVTA